MAETAEKLIKHNNLSDKITLYHGKVEGTSLPEKVDLIISEWMGTLLIVSSLSLSLSLSLPPSEPNDKSFSLFL